MAERKGDANGNALGQQLQARYATKHDIRGIFWHHCGVSPSTVVLAAWSILATRYSYLTKANFYSAMSLQQAAVPVEVMVESDNVVGKLLQELESRGLDKKVQGQPNDWHTQPYRPDDGGKLQALLIVETVAKIGGKDCSTRQAMGSSQYDVGDTNTFGGDAILLRCQIYEHALHLYVNVAPDMMRREEAESVGYWMERIVRQLTVEGGEVKKLKDIEMITERDLRSIWRWNATVPAAMEVCVHDLIADRTRQQPDASAICAWDGELTYRELDELSTRLAHHLLGLGVGPAIIVPLCFEKSMWTPVAMLGVMKAGGASVALDTTQPEERLRTIIQQVQPSVVLASAANQDLAGRVGASTVVPVDGANLERFSAFPSTRLQPVDPCSRLYVVFTSGSTGTPKGAVITHVNFSSAIKHQQGLLRFSTASRVYDFVSYAWDVSWSNILYTLTAGGCLCIPSTTDCHNNIAKSMCELAVNYAKLTPTVSHLFNPLDIPTLQVLVLGGEPMSKADMVKWSEHVHMVTTYGPAECTVVTTVDIIGHADLQDQSIGRGVGSRTWVVDPIETGRLLPVGCTGELVIEGPLVGQGYLGDAQKTTASFVEDPAWLLRGGPGCAGRRGRLYRTGDLVRYNPDGSLIFIGRKDAQVKIRGQRVELGEIEAHMARHFSIRQSASLLPKSGLCANRLVGFFSLKGIQQDDNDRSSIQLVPTKNTAQVRRHIEALEALLGDALPTYMVPSIWIALRDIPLSVSGKLDHKALEAWLFGMDSETYAKISNADCSSTSREPATDAERVLHDACSRVLNVPASSIDLQRSFVANGGDSISAMRLSPQCRAANIVFSVASLLKSKSLAAVARSSKVTTPSEISREEDFDEPFGLSPIQQWFFTQSPPSFNVKIMRRVSVDEIYRAISKIVRQHSMLRARFQRFAGNWTQRVLKPSDGLYHFGASQLKSLREVKSLTLQRHQDLDIERGPVFAADMYTLPGGDQYLILIAHHLVVDLVSWRIILGDLEALLAGDTLQVGLPFQVWNKLQTEKAMSYELDPEHVLPTEEISNDFGFWSFGQETPNAVGDHDVRSVKVDQHTTSLLLYDANNAFNTEPVDLLLSAVFDAFLCIFPRRKGLTIFNEGHGREPWSAEIDLSRTVGWFTTISPIHISRCIGSAPANIVRLVKDARRRLPSNGWAYFASRYLNRKGIGAFQAHRSTMEVAFNYHGQFQQLERDDSLFHNVTLDGVCGKGLALPASAIFDINVRIEDGLVYFFFSWNRHIAHQELIHGWITQVGPSLQSICDELTSMKTSSTLCDYEFLNLDYRGLEELESHVIPRIVSANNAAVEDVYPCSPMVDGILLSQLKEPDLYKTSQVYKIRSRGPNTVSLDGLAVAWQTVVARQPSLRTVFIAGIDGMAVFNQAVLKSYYGEVVLRKSQSEATALDMLKKLPPVDYRRLKPPTVSDNCVICQLEMSHAITDGGSIGITLRDWARAYAGSLSPCDLLETSRGFARALKSSPRTEKLAYWKTKLVGVEPCHFLHLSSAPQQDKGISTYSIDIGGEVFSQIRRFCEAQSITMGSLFQSAWALTLAACTGKDSVCFGYLASGRDLPIPGLEESIGAYANMMICRADLSRKWSGQRLVQHIHEQVLEDFGFQHCSLADIHHELNLPAGQSLFNTIMSFQKQDRDGAECVESHRLEFANIDGKNHTEYDIAVSVAHGISQLCVYLNCRVYCLSTEQACRVLSLLETIVIGLVSEGPIGSGGSVGAGKGQRRLGDIELVSHQDLEDIWRWNATVPAAMEVCVHDLIADRTRQQPDAPAICAWDGELTYRELDELSTRLAHHLLGLGVGPAIIVPLCFEKSMWTPVAMLGVMKAGGASVALDTTQPEERLRTIIQQVQPSVVLASAANQDLAGRVGASTVVPVDGANLERFSAFPSTRLQPVDPCSRLYVVFTSGSTGTPKGAVITHVNFSSAIKHQQDALGFTSSARVFDFASYAFDVSWSNLLHTLTAGGCLCVPHEADCRRNIAHSMSKLRVNYAHLTPTVARLLNPLDVPSLQLLRLGGEPTTSTDVVAWTPQIEMINSYGPSECAVSVTIGRIGHLESRDPSIGAGFGCCTWVVDPVENDRLVPVGYTGELLIEGPIVGDGYLSNPGNTEASFVEDPAWLLRGGPDCPGRHGLLYKTGDLVRYNPDGTLVFIGRKDTQVKIRGQRVELGEVEHYVRQNLANNVESAVVAEVITPQGSTNPTLVAYLAIGKEAQGPQSNVQAALQRATQGLEDRLAEQLPGYMVPSSYIPVDEMPMTATGKTDRPRLREIGGALTLEQLAALQPSRGERQAPATEMERRLQGLWASVLGIDAVSIWADDSFLRIGGDSIGAMKLVGAAREWGVSFTVADVFRTRRLSDLARVVSEITPFYEDPPPVSLIDTRNGSGLP
ncbi:hypothetical protein N7532_002990 [Penicillium argentinense]|uniref:Carrier domain-containing protein n=1 Tax=Penicillium argentinense TaxID=1131581 RepID=A0A9W9FLJ2_9EURO|nr:uncharacterized protein N7532_002990 [Penicillium argentinense]KAJ5102461.1 hypothetical protein N7532_002990 [Penicillium argentinense]